MEKITQLQDKSYSRNGSWALKHLSTFYYSNSVATETIMSAIIWQSDNVLKTVIGQQSFRNAIFPHIIHIKCFVSLIYYQVISYSIFMKCRAFKTEINIFSTFAIFHLNLLQMFLKHYLNINLIFLTKYYYIYIVIENCDVGRESTFGFKS